ncbi:hypothetical protein CC78DRAFT_581778 [Lojkania enalia]|uniref:Uncharacterized protein n=1 Tax=Lojkania enalia TaxID=147567 RepID=A0A9P4N7X8_9PLEO|nr:hypothetical protein CC78DRAFT_581778 [Didymosphaeria enalia]
MASWPAPPCTSFSDYLGLSSGLIHLSTFSGTNDSCCSEYDPKAHQSPRPRLCSGYVQALPQNYHIGQEEATYPIYLDFGPLGSSLQRHPKRYIDPSRKRVSPRSLNNTKGVGEMGIGTRQLYGMEELRNRTQPLGPGITQPCGEHIQWPNQLPTRVGFVNKLSVASLPENASRIDHILYFSPHSHFGASPPRSADFPGRHSVEGLTACVHRNYIDHFQQAKWAEIPASSQLPDHPPLYNSSSLWIDHPNFCALTNCHAARESRLHDLQGRKAQALCAERFLQVPVSASSRPLGPSYLKVIPSLRGGASSTR